MDTYACCEANGQQSVVRILWSTLLTHALSLCEAEPTAMTDAVCNLLLQENANAVHL